MNIAIIGNSHFGPILAKQLSEFDKINSYEFYNTNEKKIDKIKFALDIFKIDVVYSISASISGGGALNLALRFNKKIAQHFIGSDVLSAIEDYNNKNVNKKLIEKSQFLCEVEWIKEELREIGIISKVQTYCIVEKNNRCILPNKFSILTYLGKGKEEFYGIDTLIDIAKKLYDIEFKVAGIDTYKYTLPKNIKLLGWVNMEEELKNSVCFIRNASHDGLSFSVVEALSMGRVVFRNYKFPHTKYFKNSNDLIKKISKLKEDFEVGKVSVYNEAIEYIKKEYSKENVLSNLVNILTERL